MEIYDVVEDFELENQDGKAVQLSDYKKSPVVLFFYPRADTPGCTIESCGFRDAFEKFKDKYDLPYDLLADPEMKLIKKYGLLKNKTMYGKPVTGVERTTYLIGKDAGTGQRLLHVFEKVTPAGHAEEVFALLKASGATGKD